MATILVATQVWMPVTAAAAPPLPAGTVPTGGTVQSGSAVIHAPAGIATGQRLVIDQASQRAIINWNTFNIAAGSEVHFNQPNAGASALNRIFDLNPSIIQGTLSANGQVYLLNQNGILFDRNSQVNVHTLLASTLNMNDSTYLNPSLGLAAGQGTPALSPFAGSIPQGVTLKGTIQTQAGGAIYVFAPEVRNEGLITAPDGQVILAAGHTVYLYQNPTPTDFSMRGLFVEVKAEERPIDLTRLLDDRAVTANTVTNTGVIRAPRGNTTLAALAINQENLISASSAVLYNGSVWLQAQSRGDSSQVVRTGKVTLTAGSITETPLDTQDTTTLSEDQNYIPNRSVVKIEGREIDHKGAIRSPGGVVSLNAFDPESPASKSATRVHLDSGSIIDVSGTWAELPLSKAFLSIRVTSNDLKDAPVQKGGILLNETVTVDLREGTTLFDISGYAGGVKRTIAEKTATAGEILIDSRNGDVIMRQGATLDVSGGGYRYSGGFTDLTQLVSQGRTYSITTASADRVYDRVGDVLVVNPAKWGVTERFQLFPGLRSYEGPSIEGKNAGLISINAVGGAVLDGDMFGGTVAGVRQIAKGTLPKAGRFIAGDFGALTQTSTDFRLSNVVFAPQREVLPSSFALEKVNDDGSVSRNALPGELAGNLVLPVDFFRTGTALSDGSYDLGGFGDIKLLANESIQVPEWARIELPVAGSLTLVSRRVEVAGDILASGGSIDLRAIGTTPAAGDVSLYVAPTGTLSTRGLWINDGPALPASAKATLPRLINGGTISLSGLSTRIEEGSLIDVSGGGRIDSSGRFAAGNAGSISVAAGDTTLDLPADIVLDGEFRGYAPGRGGTFNITTGRVRIGGSPGTIPGEFHLTPEHFRTGGFRSYSVNGRFGLTVAAGTRIEPVSETLRLRPDAALNPTGSDLFAFSDRVLLPHYERTATDISLLATSGGTLALESNAVIRTDARGKAILSARDNMKIQGRIEAPAGEIRLDLTTPGDILNGIMHLADGSALVSRGTFVQRPDAYGRSIGEVLGAGTVVLNASRNGIVADEGSLIDVSGVEQVIDIAQPDGTFVANRVSSNAGTLSVTSTQAVMLNGSMLAEAPAGAAGGNFVFDLKKHDGTLLADYAIARQIVVTQAALAGNVATGLIEGHVRAGTLAQNGFDKFVLKTDGAIEFRGDIDVAFARGASFDTAEIAASGADLVRIAAPRLTIANSGDRLSTLALPDPVATRAGDTDLILEAGSTRPDGSVSPGLMDLRGHLTLNGFDSVTLRSQGDIRLTGKTVDANATDLLNRATALTGSLVSNAPILNIESARLYPSSGSEFRIALEDVSVVPGTVPRTAIRTVVPGSSISILSRPGPTARVLSAGGALTIEADNIDHGGVIQAPLGGITLAARERLWLRSGSVTDVSGAGLILPYGEKTSQNEWFYNGIAFTTPPEKRVSLTGQQVVVAAGALIDNSGGGELQGVQFVAGPGGSRDVLLQDGTYAILPWLQDEFGAYDSHMLSKKDSGLSGDTNVYDSVYLSGGAGLPEGNYVLLPGYYALLPGAYVVKAASGAAHRIMAPGQTSRLLNGTSVLAGYRTVAGTGIRESLWSGFEVKTAAMARRESEYRLADSSYFADLARLNDQFVPRLPLDGGRLVIGASGTLDFAGTLRSAPGTGGRIAEVDFVAANIAVTGSAGQSVPAGYFALDAKVLSSLNASILLGGTRSSVAQGTQISVTAGNILVANDAASEWTAPEIILAANDGITLAEDARLSAQGSDVLSTGDLVVSNAAGGSDGALLRVASGAQIQLRRNNPARERGTLDVAASAQIAASGSIILDATLSTELRRVLPTDPPLPEGFQQIVLAGSGALAVGAGNIKAGFDGSAPGSFIFTNAQLANLTNLSSLRLKSYGSLDLYGDTTLGSSSFAQIVIDAGLVQGWREGGQDSGATIQARQVVLQNLGSAPAPVLADGTGQLNLLADSVILGEGEKRVAGFGNVSISASEQVLVQSRRGSKPDTNALKVDGNLSLISGRITASSGSAQSIVASGLLAVERHLDAVQFAQIGQAAGAQLILTGNSVSFDGRVDLAAGKLKLESTGTAAAEEVLLGSLTEINVGAYEKVFAGATAYANAGQLELVSHGGGIDMEAGARVNLTGSAGGGDAGTLRISAVGGNASIRIDDNDVEDDSVYSVTLDGTIDASVANGEQGRVEIDAREFGNFSALNAKLNQSGFGKSRHVRARSGDIVIAAADAGKQIPADILIAREVKLSADSGSVRVLGTVDASGINGGGAVLLYGGQDVEIGSGGRILANGTSTGTQFYSHGGRVEVHARDGSINFSSGGLVDISAGALGDAGELVFSALRTAGNDGVNAQLNGTVAGTPGAGGRTARVYVEGRRSYAASAIAAATTSTFSAVNAVWNDYSTFMSAASSLTTGLRDTTGSPLAGVRHRAGIEIASDATDLALNTGWDLTQANWMLNGEAGRMTLRSGRNLSINNSLGLPTDTLGNASSWSLRLVGGADFSAADPMTTRNLADAEYGDVILANATSRVRSADGAIDIAAGRDFKILNASAAVFTTGTLATSDPLNRFADNGGDINIRVRRDAIGTTNQQWINEWLRRTTRPSFLNDQAAVRGQAAEWWVDRSRFRQNVGALGGGNIVVQAGNDVDWLSVMSPTSGYNPTTSTLEVYGGGDVAVMAGRDVIGGEYMLGRGKATIRADGSVGTATARTALFLLGEHNDAALRGAAFNVRAAGSIYLQNVSNPTILSLPSIAGAGTGNGFGGARAVFFTYAANSAVNLQALTGDVNIVVGTSPAKAGILATHTEVAPPIYTAVALNGNVLADNFSAVDMKLYPSEQSSLHLLAEGSIRNIKVEILDRRPELIASWRAPQVGNFNAAAPLVATALVPGLLPVITSPNSRIVAGDAMNAVRHVIDASAGDIRDLVLSLPSVSSISAGRDIVNIRLTAQNLGTADRMRVTAGRDLRLTGKTSGGEDIATRLWIGGPGELFIRAGRNIDLGTSAQGIQARGDAENTSLPGPQSAHLVVAAGLTREVGAAQSDALFSELLLAGPENDKERADAAIDALFPESAVQRGNLNMVFSTIKTQGGSGIDLFAPGGNIEAGTIGQSVTEIGIVTTLGGTIRTYLDGDFNINQSKLLTLQGGDILAYTRNGSIDAGRGALDSRTTQPPRRSTDPKTGLTVFIPPLDAAGSGIRTTTSDPDGPGPLAQPEAGSVYLFAPRGVIDAGEAGIVSGGNIVVAALQILNATNISAGGSSSGVPLAPTTTLAATVAGSTGAAGAAAAKAAEDARTGPDDPAAGDLRQAFRPTFITVELLGLGKEESDQPSRQ